MGRMSWCFKLRGTTIILSFVVGIASIALSIGIFLQYAHFNGPSLVIRAAANTSGVAWALSTVICTIGVIGVGKESTKWVKAYSVALWIHFLITLAVSAFFIAVLFSLKDAIMNSCIIGTQGSDGDKIDADCLSAYKVGVPGITAVTLAIKVLQLWLCYVTSALSQRLEEEEGIMPVGDGDDDEDDAEGSEGDLEQGGEKDPADEKVDQVAMGAAVGAVVGGAVVGDRYTRYVPVGAGMGGLRNVPPATSMEPPIYYPTYLGTNQQTYEPVSMDHNDSYYGQYAHGGAPGGHAGGDMGDIANGLDNEFSSNHGHGFPHGRGISGGSTLSDQHKLISSAAAAATTMRLYAQEQERLAMMASSSQDQFERRSRRSGILNNGHGGGGGGGVRFKQNLSTASLNDLQLSQNRDRPSSRLRNHGHGHGRPASQTMEPTTSSRLVGHSRPSSQIIDSSQYASAEDSPRGKPRYYSYNEMPRSYSYHEDMLQDDMERDRRYRSGTPLPHLGGDGGRDERYGSVMSDYGEYDRDYGYDGGIRAVGGGGGGVMEEEYGRPLSPPFYGGTNEGTEEDKARVRLFGH